MHYEKIYRNVQYTSAKWWGMTEAITQHLQSSAQSAPVSCIHSCTKQALDMNSYMKLWWLWSWWFTLIRCNAGNFSFFIRGNREHAKMKKKKRMQTSICSQTVALAMTRATTSYFPETKNASTHTQAKKKKKKSGKQWYASEHIVMEQHEHFLQCSPKLSQKKERHCTKKTIQKF